MSLCHRQLFQPCAGPRSRNAGHCARGRRPLAGARSAAWPHRQLCHFCAPPPGRAPLQRRAGAGGHPRRRALLLRNEPWEGGVRYEDAIWQDALGYVERVFPTLRRRESRAVMGLSMGGYGALLLGLRHPDLFGACASISGSTYFSHEPVPHHAHDDVGRLGAALPDDNDVFVLAERLAAARMSLAIRQSCGTEDRFGPPTWPGTSICCGWAWRTTGWRIPASTTMAPGIRRCPSRRVSAWTISCVRADRWR